MREENPKGLVDAQNKKDELVLAMKEVDLKLAENKERKRRIEEGRMELLTAKATIESKLAKIKRFIREQNVLINPKLEDNGGY